LLGLTPSSIPGPRAAPRPLHKLNTRQILDHDTIVIEDLAVTNMPRNRSLARHISGCRCTGLSGCLGIGRQDERRAQITRGAIGGPAYQRRISLSQR
jgi:hypothetical protein